MIEQTIEMPIPAELLSFKFKEAQNAIIKYTTAESMPFAQVTGISVLPSVLRTINNPAEFTRQCESAANHNALVYWMDRGTKAFKGIERCTEVLLSIIN